MSSWQEFIVKKFMPCKYFALFLFMIVIFNLQLLKLMCSQVWL